MEINEAHELKDDIITLIREIDNDKDLPNHIKIVILASIANTAGDAMSRYLYEQINSGVDASPNRENFYPPC